MCVDCARKNTVECLSCLGGEKKSTPVKTNYDSLISKTPEELAEWLVAIINHAESDRCGKSCPLYSYCIESNGEMLDWLKSPVEVDT